MPDRQPDASLFSGEVLDRAAGQPCLYKFCHPPAEGKPLVVFVPGGAHLARIAYGGHEGSRAQDFLAHWLREEGFGLLAISYPLETASQAMPATCPEFRISDWGRQAAVITRKIIDDHGLTSEVMLAAWSMGGRVVVPFTKAAEGLGLRIGLFVSLASTPGLPGLSGGNPGSANFHCSDFGYAAAPILLNVFLPQIRAQAELNGSLPIIPDEVYLRDYYGHTPISLMGWLLKHGRDHKDTHIFVDDEGQSLQDAEASEFARFPWIAILYPDSELDVRHAVADKATWNFIFTLRMMAVVEKARREKGGLGPAWKAVSALVAAAPDKLCTQMEGTHYFFVGERGAKATARAIREHWDTSNALQTQLSDLLGISLHEV